MESIAILTIGDELVEGRLVDTNAGWLSEQLNAHGLIVSEHRSVGDDKQEIVKTLRELAEGRAAILVSGGLGPTSDDLTAECAAEAFGMTLERVADAVEHLEKFFAARRREMAPTNLKQADLPNGCVVLENPRGTALGFQISTESCRLFFMPGVPHELRGMFATSVLPQLLEQLRAEPPKTATLRVFGLGESDVAQRLEGDDPVVAERGNLLFQYRATFPEIHVRIVLRGGDDSSLKGALDCARERLGRHVYASGVGGVSTTHAAVVIGKLAEQCCSLAVYDGLTGGLLTSSLLSESAAVGVLRGAKVVPVPEEDLEVAAEELRKCLGADLGLAVGPTDDRSGLEAVLVRDEEAPLRRLVRFPLPPDRMCRLGVSVGIELVRRALIGGATEPAERG